MMEEELEESFGIIPVRLIRGEWMVLLILHQQGNHWGFPKGKGDPGETPVESATRELFEETGLKVEKFIRDVPFEDVYTFYRGNRKVQKRVFYFPALVGGELLLQPEEIRSAEWLSFESALDRLTFSKPREMCLSVQRGL